MTSTSSDNYGAFPAPHLAAADKILLDDARAGFRQLSVYAFLFFCFCPYLSLLPLDSDLQPYAFIMSIVLCLIAPPSRIPNLALLLAVAPAAALLFWLGGNMSVFGFRELAVYLSPFTIALATLSILEMPEGPKMLRRAVVVATYVWLAAAICEFALGKRVLEPLIPHLQTDSKRGVTGIATEPSFYGIYCLFLLVLNYLCNSNNRKIAALLAVQILLFAQSGATIAMILPLFFYMILIYPSVPILTSIVVAAVLFVAALIYVFPLYANNRIVFVILSVISHPDVLVNLDKSVNSRVGHMLFSTLGFIESRGWPHGFETFSSYVAVRAPQLNYNWLGALDPKLKIMSGYGSALFELGYFGVSIPLGAALIILRYFREHWRMGLVAALYTTTVMFAAVQVSMPLFGVALGWMLYKSEMEPVSEASG